MKENLPNIDDLFKKVFDSADDEPANAVWQNIDKQLDKKRVAFLTKKYRKWKWVAAACLIFSAGMAMYAIRAKIINNQPDNKTIGTFKPATKNLPGRQNSSTSKTKLAGERPSNNTAPSAANSLEFSADTGKAFESTIKKEDANTANPAVANQQPASAVINKAKTNENSSPPGKAAPNSKLFQKKNIQQQTAANKRQIKQPTAINSQVVVKGRDNITAPKKSQQPIVTEGRFEPLYHVSMAIEKHPEVNTGFGSAGTIQLSESHANDYLADLQKQNMNRLKNYAKSSGLSRLSASVFYSFESVGTQTKNDFPRFREDERNIIKNNEKSKEVSTKGLLINLALNNKWSIETGITATSITTHFKPRTIYARPDDNGRINFRFSCAAGTTNLIVKQGNPPASGDSLHASSSNNRLQYIGIPLSIRYLFTAGNFSLQPGLGVSLFILTENKIETDLTTNTGIQKITAGNINGLKQTYLNGMFSLKASYNINKFLSVDFTPAARFGLSSINKQTPVKTNINTIGAGFGISYKIL